MVSKHNILPTKEEAEEILLWAHTQNPGPWLNHSRVVARIAEKISSECGLDSHRAYVSGLLHDIGRYEGVRGLHHIYAGYALMNERGYTGIADICLSHSFPYQNLGAYIGGDFDCSPDEMLVITSFLDTKLFDDYDRLTQLGDAMGSAHGVTLIDIRVLDVVRRYGFNDLTLKKLDATFSLKSYFDEKCKLNIYDLFHDEIIKTALR